MVQSAMKSSYNIYCTSYDSCLNSAVLAADSLFCTMNACTDSTISSVNKIYLFDTQSGMEIYSDNINTMDIYLRGITVGYVTVYCNVNSICTIDCGINACNSSTTILTCYGNCLSHAQMIRALACTVVIV